MEIPREKLRMLLLYIFNSIPDNDDPLTKVEEYALSELALIYKHEYPNHSVDEIMDIINEDAVSLMLEELCQCGLLNTYVDENGEILFTTSENGEAVFKTNDKGKKCVE